MKKNEKIGLGLVGLAALLLYLANKSGLLHESVTTKIGGIITPQGTTTSDTLTGAPQYDVTQSSTIPANEEFAIPPICGGAVTFSPSNPKNCSCPQGYILWHEVSIPQYVCIPSQT